VWDALKQSADKDLAAIAEKSVKEVRYHLQHSRDWLVKLGDGTEESHHRTQAALNHLFAYTQEFWTDSAAEKAALQTGVSVDLAALRPTWDQIIEAALAEATLQKPATSGYVTEGKHGIHSEHLGFLLAEMQSLARAIPEATW
jgi:ring-1,2-phenylacetyl-CoA epoxidase subunit PaaC